MALGLFNLGAGLFQPKKVASSAVVKRNPQKDAIVKKESSLVSKTKTISKEKLLNIKPPEQPKQSTQSSGVSSIDSVLDKIDNTLFNLINVAGKSVKLQQNKLKKDKVKEEKEKKKKREDMLENTQKAIAALGSKVPQPVKSIWDRLKTFFGSVLIGSLVLFILKNWSAIVKTIQNMVEKIKELLVKLEPILIPVWNFAKWMVVKSVELTAGLVGVEDADKNTILKNLGEITKKGMELFGVFKGVQKFVNDIRGGKEPAAAQEIPALTGKDDPRIKRGKELKNQGAGAGIVEKMFPKSEQEDAQNGSDAVNRLFGHEVDGDQSSLGGGLGVKDGDLIAMADTSQQPISPQAVYNYLRSKGVSDTHAEGMIANIAAESSFRPWVMGDNGTSGGLFQHHASRFAAMKAFVGKDWRTNWKGQIDYALSEDDTGRYLGIKFKTSADASRWFTLNWERPADAKTKAEDRIKKHLRNFELDTHLPYEMNRGPTNVFVSKNVSSPVVQGGSGTSVLPIPLLNSGVETAQSLAQYELTTV